MIKKYKWQLIISSVLILLPALTGVWFISLFMLVVHWLCILFTVKDSKTIEQNGKVFCTVLWIIPIISLAVCGVTFAISRGQTINADAFTRILLGLLFTLIGNYIPKCRPNHTIGVRVNWTLRNEENWTKTHRFAGRLWVLCGVLILASLLIPSEHSIWLFLAFTLIASFAPVIYSYCYYRKQLQEGTATRESVQPTPEEKKTTKTAVIMGGIVLLLTIMFLMTGQFDLTYDETSLRIDATYWSDYTLSYEEISRVELRPAFDAGSRSFGYGTPSLLMGQCQNAEFNQYLAYLHLSCDSCVLVYTDEGVLAVNGETAEETQVILEELNKRISQ